MAVVNLSESILKDTADAIREMTGDTEPIKPIQFPDLILSIETGPAVESISIVDKSKNKFQPGEEATYNISILPAAANQKFTATSSNNSVATVTVNDNGTITVKALENDSMTEDDEFTATITVKAGGRNPKTDMLTVTVKLVTIPEIDKNNVNLDILTEIVQAGLASECLQLGDELFIDYDGTKMPMRVVGFADAVIRQNGTDVTIPAIQMEMKYCATGTTPWGESGTTNYSVSRLDAFIVGQVQSKFTEEFLTCLGETKVQYYNRNTTTDACYRKMFAPSIAQLGITNSGYYTAQQASVEGPAFQYYQDATDTKRIKQAIDAPDTAQIYYTRSACMGKNVYYGYILTTGVLTSNGYYTAGYRTVAACNFIGKTA